MQEYFTSLACRFVIAHASSPFKARKQTCKQVGPRLLPGAELLLPPQDSIAQSHKSSSNVLVIYKCH